MKIILKENIRGLGQKGDIKEVSEGYYRNFLFPRRLAQIAEDSQVAHIQAQKAKSTEKLENMKESALSVKERIEGKSIELFEKMNESGKLYAAIDEKEIIEALEKQLNVKIPASALNLKNAIKSTGEFDLTVNLYKNIKAEVKVNVKSK